MTEPNAFSDFRKRTGQTLDATAEQFGVDRKTILRWEQGSSPIPADRVLTIERITGISRHELRPDLSRIFVDGSRGPAGNDAEAA
jgi:DNA-binding transcriptional regulator YdaS (Cro superfamily)